MIYRRYTIDLIFRGGWMRKFFIVLITGVVIISAIALYFIVDNFNINAMDTTERMTFFLQVLAGFVTACISTWGLSIAHRQIKHWEIEQCNKLWEECCPIFEKWNLNQEKFDEKIAKDLTIKIFNFYERLALLEIKSYIDSDILYDRFYPDLFELFESGIFDNYLKERYNKDSYIFYHTRTLYNKWKERHNSEKDHKDLTDSWGKMVGLKKVAKEK